MKIGYLEVVEVKKIRSRNVCQLIVEADINQFKELVMLDEMTGVFIPCEISGAVCGARELDVETSDIEALMGITSQQVEPPDKPEPPKGGAKSLAQRMAIDGYFRHPQVWHGMHNCGAYTLEQHYKYVKSMTPINLYPGRPGTGDVVAHHVRTAENSGTGTKPPHWFCIPLYSSHHQHLHAQGPGNDLQDHLESAIAITEKAMRAAFKKYLSLTTLSGFTKDDLLAAEQKMDYKSGYVRAD